MNELNQALASYLALRRALGFKLEKAEKRLQSFVEYMQEQQSSLVTTEMALAWVNQSNNLSPPTRSEHLSVVRGFARHLHASNPLHEVPPSNLLPCRKIRHQPYIYSDEDVVALLQATQRFRHPLKASTYATLFGLLAVTGMRRGEALALDRSDIDWNEALLLVRNAKFQKSREVPLHPTTVHALRLYVDKRDEFFPSSRTPSFFVSPAGTRLLKGCVHYNFVQLLRSSGLSQRRPRPRIHDLRHSFAVNTLRRWYEAALEVEPRLPSLSTYLGHVAPSATYWYLTATPALMALAAKRLQASMEKLT
ncbi:MAG: tyrosine-type recombinase/integrase [Vicinamibacteria bacterium]